MQPAAVLAAIVRVQGVKQANVALGALQGNLVRTDAAATAAGNSASRAGTYIKSGLGVAAVLAAYGVMKGVKAGAEFEKQIDSLSSVSKANRKELKLLEKQALKFGETTIYSATSAAEAQKELAKGGLSVEQIYKGGLKSALQLAAAGEITLAESGIITANAMKLFKIKGEDAAEVADILAIAANNTTAEVADFGMSLKQGGGVARLVGYDLSQTITILESLAEAGIKNSDAGTSMKAAMIQLVTPSKKQKEMTKELNLEFFNQAGEMKNAAGISKELRRATKDMTREQRGNVIATLAGTDGIRTLNALYEAGPEKLKALEKAHNKTGYAQEVMSEKTDNLAYDWERFKNVIEVIGIKLEQVLDPALRGTVQEVTEFLQSMAKLENLDDLIEPALIAVSLLLFKFGGAFSKAGYGAALSFGKGMAKGMPTVLAALGFATIVSSAIEGDMEAVGFKAGGALLGGLLGFLAGGPAGAMAGAGLGALIGKMFADQNQHVSKARELADATRSITDAVKDEKSQYDNLADSGKRILSARDAEKRAAHRVKQAEKALADARSGFGIASQPAIRAEAHLKILRGEQVQKIRAVKRAERAYGVERQALKQIIKSNVAAEKENIANLRILQQKQLRKLAMDLDEHKSVETIRKDYKNLGKTNKELKETKEAYNQTLARASRKIGPEWANWVKNSSALVLNAVGKEAEKFDTLRRTFQAISKHEPIKGKLLNDLKELARKSRSGTGAVKELKGAFGPMANETQRQMGRAKGDVGKFSAATSKGIERVAGELGDFAGELGIKNVKFGSKKKPPKRQKGGMVVPGVGAGDKVRMVADVEPGEVIHVLNKRAAADRTKLGELEYHNSRVPRFARGGTFVDPLGPGHGVVNRAIAGVVGKWSSRYNASIDYGYDPGGGHISPGHNITGTATDTTPAAGWEAGTKIFEAGLRAVEGKVDQILYGSHGIGEAYPNHGWGNHAHIEWGMHPAVQGILGQMISKMKMTGPPGDLRDVGQAVLDRAVQMANKKLQQLGGIGGGADIGDFSGPGKIVGASTFAPDAYTGTVGASGKSLIGRMAFAELGMGHNLGGLPFGSKLLIKHGGRSVVGEKLDIGAGGGDVDGHRRDIDLWYETAEALGLPGQPHPGWLGLVEVQKRMRGGMLDLGRLQKGGTKGKGKAKSPFTKPLHTVAGTHFKKGKAMVRKLNRKLEGMGFAPDSPVIKRLADLTTDVEKYDEFAAQASALSIVDEDGNVTPGLFKGQDEAYWLNQKLSSLMGLRKQLIAAHDIAEQKTEKTTKLLHEAKKRLNKVRKAISEGEAQKRKIEQKVKDLERARDEKTQQLEKEKKELERKLDQAQSAKTPNAAYINQIRGEIKSKNFAISHTGEEAHAAIKAQKEALRELNKKQAGRRRVEDSLANTLVPTLEGKREDLLQTQADLYGSGGSVGSRNYMGLQTVQGTGITLDELPNPPDIGTVGGELFGTLNRLREIGAEAEKAKVGGAVESETEKLLAELKLAEEMEWKKRFIASQYQQEVIANFPTVPQMGQIPGYALGGVTSPVWVGERGKELLFPPVGSRVVSHREATQAAGDHQGAVPLVIESLVINEADGTVEIKSGGHTTEAEVKSVTRRQARKAMSPTPGGTNR